MVVQEVSWWNYWIQYRAETQYTKDLPKPEEKQSMKLSLFTVHP
jgi:hypothetical protein